MEKELNKVLRKSRFALGAGNIDTLTEEKRGLLDYWLNKMPTEVEGINYKATVPLAYDKIKAQITGHPDLFIQKLGAFIQEEAVSATAANKFLEVMSTIEVTELDSWLLLTGTSFDLGVTTTLKANLSDIMPFAVHPSDAVWESLERSGIHAVHQMGFSLSKDGGYTTLVVDLPGQDKADQMMLVHRVFDRLGITEFSAEIKTLLETKATSLQLLVSWGEMGIYTIGVRASVNNHELMFRLLVEANREGEEVKFAVFEALIEAEQPVYIDLLRDTSGVQTEISYSF